MSDPIDQIASPNLDKMINGVMILSKEEILLVEIHLEEEDHLVKIPMKDDPVVEVIQVVTDAGLTVIVDTFNVKIEEILILRLSLKSTLLELFEILVSQTLKSTLVSSERSRISL
jgi:hypothetical protein